MSLEQTTFCIVRSFPSVAMVFWLVSTGNSASFRLCLQPLWCCLLTAFRHVCITVVTYLFLGNIVPSECGLVPGCQRRRHIWCTCDDSSCLYHWLLVTATHSASLHLYFTYLCILIHRHLLRIVGSLFFGVSATSVQNWVKMSHAGPTGCDNDCKWVLIFLSFLSFRCVHTGYNSR